MPSKRHGYLTRKQWLAERLEDARDRAGAFDVERLLRATSYYQTHTQYTIVAPESPNGLTYDLTSPSVRVRYTLTPYDMLARDGLLIEGVADKIEIELYECTNGFLCHNYFPVGDPVNNVQHEVCERCGAERDDDCS